MKRRVLPWLAAALGAAVVLSNTSGAAAHAGMRCGNKLVGEGDSPYRVRQLCGAPVDARQHTELRTVAVRTVHPATGRVVLAERTVEVLVEEWWYDFGPQKFVRRVRFEQGRLVRVDTESYGTAR